jgi:hypothetical protein
VKFILIFFLTAFAILRPPESCAALIEPLPIGQLTTNAEVIVHGTVLSKSVERDPEGRIFTRVKLRITEVWKGTVNVEEFSIVHGGGRIGNTESRASIQVNYYIGEEIVAMLRFNQRHEGVTLGLVQGKFLVETDPTDGVKTVSNIFHGRSPTDAHKSSVTRPAQPRLTLDDFKRQVKGGQL